MTLAAGSTLGPYWEIPAFTYPVAFDAAGRRVIAGPGVTTDGVAHGSHGLYGGQGLP